MSIKKNIKKLFAVLLAFVMVGAAIACGKGNNTSGTTGTGTGVPAAFDTDEPELDLPDIDLKGFKMTILRSSTYFTENGIWSDDQLTGDKVSEAVYRRNASIEETYQCEIALLPSNSYHPSQEIPRYILSGDNLVDVVVDGGAEIVSQLENFYDLNKLDYFDFSKPWWNLAFNEGVSLCGKLYLTVGSYMLAARQHIFQVMFDMEVAKEIGIEPASLYKLVDDNSWTLEIMTRYAKTANKDLNGDQIMSADDRYGLLGQVYDNWTLALGAGLHTVEKDKDDMPTVVINSDRNNTIVNTILKLTGDYGTTLFAERMTGVDDVWAKLNQLSVADGQWLFLCGAIVDPMRSKLDDYGILPSPKLDETQTRYYHDASLGNSPTTAVPVTAKDADKVSYILEVMSYKSYKDVLPVFYQSYLDQKLARDEDSVRMLRLIHDSLYYDVGAMFNWGGMHAVIATMTDHSLLASQYASIAEKIVNEMNSTLDEIMESSN